MRSPGSASGTPSSLVFAGIGIGDDAPVERMAGGRRSRWIAPATGPPVQDSAVAIFSPSGAAQFDQGRDISPGGARRSVIARLPAGAPSRSPRQRSLLPGQWNRAFHSSSPSPRPNRSARRRSRRSAARIASRCGPIFGASADDRCIDMGEAFRRVLSAWPPLWRGSDRRMRPSSEASEGGKWLPMSPIRDRAEDRVGDRMQHHVGVRVADQGSIVRDADAAQRDVISRPRSHARRSPWATFRLERQPARGVGQRWRCPRCR